MKLCLLALALIVGQVCFAEETTTVPSEVKNGTGAPGRYHGRQRHRGGYDHDEYNYRTPIVDDYICDLEATILVVSSKHHVKEEKSYGGDQKYGGGQEYGNQGGYGGQGGNNYNQGGGDYNQGGGYGGQGGNYNQGGNNYNQGGGDYNQGGNNYNQQSSPSYGNGPYRAKRSNGGYGAPSQSYDQPQQYQSGGGYEEKTRRHEYATPEALRLKCSHIAVHSEHDCHTCCQLSARRYHSVSKNDIFGFIIDANEIKYDDKGYVRSKRNTNGYAQTPAPEYQQQQNNYNSAPAPGYESQGSYPAPAPEYGTQTQGYSSDSGYQSGGNSYAPSNYHYGPPKNARCVCCAPKRHHHENYQRRRHHDRHDRYDRSDSREY